MCSRTNKLCVAVCCNVLQWVGIRVCIGTHVHIRKHFHAHSASYYTHPPAFSPPLAPSLSASPSPLLRLSRSLALVLDLSLARSCSFSLSLALSFALSRAFSHIHPRACTHSLMHNRILPCARSPTHTPRRSIIQGTLVVDSNSPPPFDMVAAVTGVRVCASEARAGIVAKTAAPGKSSALRAV